LQGKLEAINPKLKAGLAAVDARHKAWLKLLDMTEKQLRARQWAAFDGDTVREAKKALLPRDVKKREKLTVRDSVLEAFKRASYFIAQSHWLFSRFPDGDYADVPGLCKAVSRADIAANDYSLTAGRYVGVAVGLQEDDDGEAFAGRMKEIHSELAELNEKAVGLAATIQATFEEMFE
jgi:type I restriction enzyme M protein